MTTRQQLAITVGGVVAVALLAVMAARHGPFPAAAEDVVPRMYVGAVCIGAGVLVGRWRPGNGTSWLLVAAGAMLLLRLLAWSNDPRLFTLGGVLAGVDYAVLAHLALAMPDGRLTTMFDRFLAVTGYALAIASGVIPNLYYECQSAFGFGCPGNLLLVRDDPAAVARSEDVFAVVGTVFVVVVIARLVRRWQAATELLRRVVGPCYAAVGAALVLAVLDLLEVWDRWGAVAALVHPLVVSLIPFAVLIGVLHSKARAGDIGALVVSVEQTDLSLRAELERLLARTLVDPTLRLDVADGAASVPAGPGRVRIPITADGRTLAVMDCDRAVGTEPEVLAAVVATASLALDIERLVAEVRCQLDDANRSRARLVAAQVQERQRLERDLHDGAQQRLVTTRLLLSMSLERDGERRLVADALHEVGDAIGELRDLARGVHPATVTEHGLSVAIESLAERAPLPVAVHGTAPRLAPLSEVTAYFVVAEALTNVAKHADATHADVHLSIVEDRLAVSIRDDGRGGADPSRGTGLVGLRDRVEAAGGSIEVHSEPGAGTTVCIELPGSESDRVQPGAGGAP